MMRILITGRNGLLAHALGKTPFSHGEKMLVGREQFDLTLPETMSECLKQHRPAIVVNTAAYNQVDRCETDRGLSWAVNAEGPQTLAKLCLELGVRLVHFGSDYVFDGEKESPYVEANEPKPLNHYGAGKLFGERAVLETSGQNLVLRTSWLFGPHPNQRKSYVDSVIGQARSGHTLKATTDQVSAPTYAPDLARWTLDLIRGGASGLFHAVNDFPVSRYEWTKVILEDGQKAGLWSDVSVEAVASAYFNPRMRRPAYSAMDNRKMTSFLGQPAGAWRTGLNEMLANYRRETTGCD